MTTIVLRCPKCGLRISENAETHSAARNAAQDRYDAHVKTCRTRKRATRKDVKRLDRT